MKQLTRWMIALAAMAGSALQAQNLPGTWQGALNAGTRELRVVFKVSLEDDKLKAIMYSIDQGAQPIPATTITRDGPVVKMTVAAANGTYEGRLSADGNSIAGTWSQGVPLPLNLTRATNETAWTIPEPPPPPKLMAADAKPQFEVATIKPSAPGERFSILVNRSGLLTTTNTTLSDLIKFAYGLHPRQITRGPAWLESEHFTITAKPDTEGMPNGPQLKTMMQKLLEDRFKLKFHTEKKELSVYAITVTKTGAKLTKNDSGGSLPGFGGGGPRGLNAMNATMAEFAGMLQLNILDQPVVDQTGLGATRYNFILKWTPDASQIQLAGGPVPPPAADNADAPPDLFLAFQQQLGLKLESTKALADVMVIDGVEKPSEN